jgi:hypothetical protein
MKKNQNRETIAQWPIKVSVTVVGGRDGHEVEFTTVFPDGHAFGCKSRHGSVALDANLDAIRWWVEQQLGISRGCPGNDCIIPTENEA